jgi:hypothetical protein
MKQSHLATAAFWVGLLTLFGWQASAQIPRPPMPIPGVVAPAPPPRPVSAPKVANLMPATIPLTRSSPTPIPPATATTEPAIPIPPHLRLVPAPIPVTMPVAPLHVALPPPEFDRPYTGKLTVLKEDNFVFIRHVCADVPNAVACSFRTYDSISGETLSCLIMLGPGTWEDERALRHETAHCNGWPGDHPGARYGD